MKRTTLLVVILTIGLTGCQLQNVNSKIIPTHVDKFARDFLTEVHNGNIDKSLEMVLPEINNAEGKQFLTTTYTNIQTLSLDSLSIITASKSTMHGEDGFTQYNFDYECKAGSKYVYFTFGIREQNSKLFVGRFNGEIRDASLGAVNEFTLKDKGFGHYLFLLFAILIPIFIILTLVVAARTKLKRKWLWIVGILFGFIKFSINWTTGQIGFQLLSMSILGAGIVKSGVVAEWILSFSLPIVAIAFWSKKLWVKKEPEHSTEVDAAVKGEESDN